MDILSLAELGETERRLLATFVQYGRDGRALTTQSLAANAGMAVESKRLAMALNNLAVRGLSSEAAETRFPARPSHFDFPVRYSASRVYRGIRAFEVPDTTWADRTEGQTHATKSGAIRDTHA
jgi:hypothetical protein